ncbi:O-methyltransferase involved in polyketide biosynthesis [Rhizobium sp. PP-CC-2G-626]|nr:O-methyltransferase involved in polyketide biosynthesis [Rhizobium sp. PP-CC-2G-626]
MAEKLAPALRGASETLLITLAARLLARTQNPDLGFADPAAQAIGAALDFDPARFAADRASMRGSIVRALWFDGIVHRFAQANPGGLVVSIGSGLDTRAHRLDLPGGVDWIDIDCPEVIVLRDALVSSLPRVRNLAGDGSDVLSWVDLVEWKVGRAVLVIAEGVSMYFEPLKGEAWLRSLAAVARLRGCTLTLALDLASPFMVRHGRRNPSVRKTQATLRWGVSEPAEIKRLGVGFETGETFDVTCHSGLLSHVLGMAHRALTGRPLYSCASFITGNA